MSESPVSLRQGARRDQLRQLVLQNGPLRLDEAARALGVSGMTLRRDLAGTGTGLTLLGGTIVPAEGLGPGRYTLDAEGRAHEAAKAEAGRHAATLVRPGDTVFVDCGTTLPHLLAALPPDLELTIVCYSLNIAAAASRLKRAQLFLLGGLFHPASATFFSEHALRELGRLGITRAFLSAGGLHPRHGATCSNFNEVPVKRAILDHAAEAFLVIDESKRDAIKPARFAAADRFAAVVTETGVECRMPSLP